MRCARESASPAACRLEPDERCPQRDREHQRRVTIAVTAPPARKARGVSTRFAGALEAHRTPNRASLDRSAEAREGNSLATHRVRRREPRGLDESAPAHSLGARARIARSARRVVLIPTRVGRARPNTAKRAQEKQTSPRPGSGDRIWPSAFCPLAAQLLAAAREQRRRRVRRARELEVAGRSPRDARSTPRRLHREARCTVRAWTRGRA